MPLLSRFRVLTQEDSSVTEEHPLPHPLPAPPQPPVAGPDTISLPRHYSQIARVLRPFMPPTCHWFNLEDVKLIGDHPVAAGETADIWEATHDGRKLILKSHRCSVTFDVAQAARRYCNEVRISTLLHREAVGVVALAGVYSTERHPFGVIYEYMDNLDLKQFSKNKPYVERLKLLADVARALNRIHNLGIVHGGLRATNVLVDKDGTPHISGLGNAHILPGSAAWTMEGGTGTDHTHASDLAVGVMSPGEADSTPHSKARDVHDFGLMAFEVLTERRPFLELTGAAAIYSMLKGDRPHRPTHPGISDGIWNMIERCWQHIPSQRISIEAVVGIFVTELTLLGTYP